jgi:hypothetical protein
MNKLKSILVFIFTVVWYLFYVENNLCHYSIAGYKKYIKCPFLIEQGRFLSDRYYKCLINKDHIRKKCPLKINFEITVLIVLFIIFMSLYFKYEVYKLNIL